MSKKLHLWVGLSPVILSVVLSAVILTAQKYLPSKMPLFYSLSWGEGQLASSSQFLIIPASISAVALLNVLICWQLHKSQSFFRTILLLSSVIVSLILTVTFIKIIFLFI